MVRTTLYEAAQILLVRSTKWATSSHGLVDKCAMPRASLRSVLLICAFNTARMCRGESVEKREPASDIDTATLDSLKALDPDRPTREADIDHDGSNVRFVPKRWGNRPAFLWIAEDFGCCASG
jgi:hypothetical protein